MELKNIEALKELAKNGIMTHAGKIHQDECHTAALLALADVCDCHEIERSFVIGVDFKGLAFDIGGGKFDHHQENAEIRPSGKKYAAFGLMWRYIGVELCQYLTNCSVNVAEKAAAKFDQEYVELMDLTDNYGQQEYPNTIAYLVSKQSGTTFDPSDETFYNIVLWLRRFMLRTIMETVESVKLEERAKELGTTAVVVLEDEEFISAQLFKGTKAKYIVSKSNREGYNINCVPGNTIFLGKVEMPGCTFVHPASFIAVFDTKENAVQAAEVLASTN